MQFAATVTTAQQTGQQCLTAAHGPADHEAFTVGIIRDQALIPFELRP